MKRLAGIILLLLWSGNSFAAKDFAKELKALLNNKAAYEVPEQGRREGAIINDVNVQFLQVKDSEDEEAVVQQFTKDRVDELLDEWREFGQNVNTLQDFFGKEVTFNMRSGFEDKTIREALNKELLKPKHREALAKILNHKDFSAFYQKIDLYDRTAEIIGSQLILIYVNRSEFLISINIGYAGG